MPHTTHMATVEDDERHEPGAAALPLWNESYWFPLYDPGSEIGIVFRIGVLPCQARAAVYLFLTHRGEIVHSMIDHAATCPPYDPRRLAVGELEVEIEEPCERLRLRYRHGEHAFNLEWRATSPTYLYPAPPDATPEEYPRHLEQGGIVTGSVTLAGTEHAFEGLGHRDHSFGGERDWAKFHSWTYLSGELGPDFWFHAVRFTVSPDAPDFTLGCLWDGHELVDAAVERLEVQTADGTSRQTGVELVLRDEHGRRHHLVSDGVLVDCPVQFGRTWLKDGFTRFRMGERVGYGIHEHGYVEKA